MIGRKEQSAHARTTSDLRHDYITISTKCVLLYRTAYTGELSNCLHRSFRVISWPILVHVEAARPKALAWTIKFIEGLSPQSGAVKDKCTSIGVISAQRQIGVKIVHKFEAIVISTAVVMT